MGKMMKALEKAKELRNNGYAMTMPVGSVRGADCAEDHAHGNGVAKFDTKIVVVCAVIFMVSLMSLLVSFKAMKELGKAENIATILVKNLSGQKEDLRHIKQLVSETTLDKTTHVEQMTEKLNDLKLNYNLLKISLEDLKISDRLLLEKYISLNDQVKELVNGE